MISRSSTLSPNASTVGADSGDDGTEGGARKVEGTTVPSWQRSLASAFTRLDDLLDYLNLDVAQLGDSWTSQGTTDQHSADQRAAAQRQFPMRVPRAFAERMVKGDPDDPLLRQVLPVSEEMQPTPGFINDPLRETPSSPLPGLLHKYRRRALLVTTGACAVHCRYCFRRHFPYVEHAQRLTDAQRLTKTQRLTETKRSPWQPALDYLARNSDIEEVILSGGDPLSLSDSKLADLMTELERIPHLRRLRWHTRLPVVLPERVDKGFLSGLTKSRLQQVMVLHINHGNEIDDNVVRVANELRHIGVTLLNQAVLLRRVNDSVEALVDLSQKLFDAGVLPYYLHLLDRVQGAAHFEVNETHARQLFRQLLGELPGFLVPRLVREIPSASSKMPVSLVEG